MYHSCISYSTIPQIFGCRYVVCGICRKQVRLTFGWDEVSLPRVVLFPASDLNSRLISRNNANRFLLMYANNSGCRCRVFLCLICKLGSYRIIRSTTINTIYRISWESYKAPVSSTTVL